MNKLIEFLNAFGPGKLKVKAGFAEAEWDLKDDDRDAAWELYVELLTRTATQPLAAGSGNEKIALESVHSLFRITREILRAKGRKCFQFTKIAVIVLNQIVRPFTTKWHTLSEAGAFSDQAKRAEFRTDLAALQQDLRIYSRLLAEIANVEDLTHRETE
jgi:hypothetical protein